jgi:hypothetical protein
VTAAASTVGVEMPISKSEFARRRRVTPGRVTQWIDAQQIRPPALVGEGRSAQIIESLAVAQLGRTLDISQRLGNGAGTNLKVEPTADILPLEGRARSAPAAKTAPEIDQVGDAIRLEQLEKLQRTNRREAVERFSARCRRTIRAAPSR